MGVLKMKNRWRASMWRNGQHYHLGLFDTKQEAEEWLKKAEAHYDKTGEVLKKLKELKSGVQGIYWHNHRKYWEVRWKRKYIGSFKDLNEAKLALEKHKESLLREEKESGEINKCNCNTLPVQTPFSDRFFCPNCGGSMLMRGNKMAKYRKKPVVVEAIQLKEDNVHEVLQLMNKYVDFSDPVESDIFYEYRKSVIREGMRIHTLEGIMTAKIGDYIIKGAKGELYPCKQDIFEETYERVEE